jgi:hypothetical protein
VGEICCLFEKASATFIETGNASLIGSSYVLTSRHTWSVVRLEGMTTQAFRCRHQRQQGKAPSSCEEGAVRQG